MTQKSLLDIRNTKGRDYQQIADINAKKLVGRDATPVEAMLSEDAYCDGFDAAIELMLEREKKLREALVNAEKELFRFNCEAPLTLTAIEKPEYLSIREVLIAVPELK